VQTVNISHPDEREELCVLRALRRREQSTLEWVEKNMRFIGFMLQNLASDHDFSPKGRRCTW
jgi:hypothetical protein